MLIGCVCRVGALLAVALLPGFSVSIAERGMPARAGVQTTTAGTETFPALTAEALDRNLLTFPRQVEGRLNLVFLFWARDQAAQIDTWSATAQALQHASFDFRSYRMLVSARENALYRWWDNNSLRSAETDPEMLHWTVPLYTDKSALRRSLGLTDDEHTVVILLLDRAGRVLWKDRGVSTEAGRASLVAAVRQQ